MHIKAINTQQTYKYTSTSTITHSHISNTTHINVFLELHCTPPLFCHWYIKNHFKLLCIKKGEFSVIKKKGETLNYFCAKRTCKTISSPI